LPIPFGLPITERYHLVMITSTVQLSRKTRSILRTARNAIWLSERAVVYGLPSGTVNRPGHQIEFTGINSLSRDSDRLSTGALNDPYKEFVLRGDDGLLAWSADQIAGWLWLRSGPFEERVGSGIALIDAGITVLRYVEVLPQVRNRGVATQMLVELARRLDDSARVIAFVGASNIPSIKAFNAAEYTRLGTVTFRRIVGHTLKVTPPMPPITIN
jgi:ribosomal protein S18 acetylase RimI-like enzyme